MPVGPQYSSEFGNTSGSMNGLQVLAGAERAELAVGVAQAEGGLAFVDAGAEQLELEGGLQVAHLGWRRRPDAEAALSHAGESAAVLAVLILERGQLGDAHACRTSSGGSA